MADSKEHETLRKKTKEMEIALRSDRDIVHFLYRERFISHDVYEEVLDPRSMLTATEKSSKLVICIRNKVKLNPQNYHKLLHHFRQDRRNYGDITDILDNEYSGNALAPQINAASQDTHQAISSPEVQELPTLTDTEHLTTSHSVTEDIMESNESYLELIAATDDSELGINDLGDVLNEVESLSFKWKQLTTKLHVRYNSLELIQCNNPNDSATCLLEALVEWLKLNYDISRYGKPSWRMLAKAVESIDYSLFKRITTKHRVDPSCV